MQDEIQTIKEHNSDLIQWNVPDASLAIFARMVSVEVSKIISVLSVVASSWKIHKLIEDTVMIFVKYV